jgi:2-keto-4-pentenoate hydratase
MDQGGEGRQGQGGTVNVRPLSLALVQAWRTHVAFASAAWAGALADAREAYAVQDEVAREMGWFGANVPRHWKSGGPSREAALTHAPLPPAGVIASPAEVSAWPLHARTIEPEIALRLGQDVTAEAAARLTHDGVDALIDAMAVSIEVVDSRWAEGTQAPALLRLADLQSHAALVLGDWRPYERRDWRAQRCMLQIGDAPASDRVGTHSLGDPAWVLPAWLQHATRHGATVPGGTVVTTGTWAGAVPVRAGDWVRVRFDGIGEASVHL